MKKEILEREAATDERTAKRTVSLLILPPRLTGGVQKSKTQRHFKNPLNVMKHT